MDLGNWERTFDAKWISVITGEVEKEDTIDGGGEAFIEVPDGAGWYVVLIRV